MKVRRGEVVLVDFPYSDHTGSKVRPALVVQADAWNQRLDDTILALITSSRHRRVGAATQFVIDITTAEGQQTGLRLNSVIQCENLLTYDQALILRVLGRLSATSMEQINAYLKAALGIS
jgi:mRNA interferase MazF